jgi:hypothetical protein
LPFNAQFNSQTGSSICRECPKSGGIRSGLATKSTSGAGTANSRRNCGSPRSGLPRIDRSLY